MAKELVHSPAFAEEFDPKYRTSRGLSVLLSQADTILLNEKTTANVATGSNRDIGSIASGGYSQNISRIDRRSARLPIDGRRMNGGIAIPPIDVGITSDPVVTTLGYNYHAVAHRMFGPGQAFILGPAQRLEVGDIVRKYGAHGDYEVSMYGYRLYNMFECARIERLMIAAYPSTRSYFVSASYNKVSSILMSEQNGNRHAKLFGAYMYLALRPYLARPIRLRALNDLRKELPRHTPRIDDTKIMNALNGYLTRAYSGGNRKDWVTNAVRDTYSALLEALPCQDAKVADAFSIAFYSEFMSTCDTVCNQEGDAPEDKQDQEKLQEVAYASQNDESGEGGGQGQEGDGDAQEDAQEGTQDGGGSSSLDETIKAAMEEARDSIMEDDSTRREVEDIRQSIGAGATHSPRFVGERRSPFPDYVLMQKHMAREFGKIIEDADPGFMTHQPSGRVSMKRAMHGIDDYDTAFDVWDEGKLSASSMEVTLLIDNSGSMSGCMDSACQAAWAITRGIESLGSNARVTKFFFNSSSALSKSAVEREGASYMYHSANGGTDPLAALVDSHKILTESGKVHRLCIILTDGMWYGGSDVAQPDGRTLSDADVVIERMQAKGVKVALANMFDERYYTMYTANNHNLRHGADVERRIEGPKDFVAFARSIVKEAMTK